MQAPYFAAESCGEKYDQLRQIDRLGYSRGESAVKNQICPYDHPREPQKQNIPENRFISGDKAAEKKQDIATVHQKIQRSVGVGEMSVEKESGHLPDLSRKFREGETVLLLYDGRQGLHGFPVDAGLQGDTVMMGRGLIGGTGYPERSVGLLVGIVVRIALVIVDRLAGFGVCGESVPVLRTVGRFLDQKKGADNGYKNTGQSKEILSAPVEAEKTHGGILSGIQIFSQSDHADHGEEHQKGVSPDGEAARGEEKKDDVVFQSFPERIGGGGERKEKERSASCNSSYGSEL